MRILVVVRGFSKKSIEVAIGLAKNLGYRIVFYYIMRKGFLRRRRICLEALVPAEEIFVPQAQGSLKNSVMRAFNRLEEAYNRAREEGADSKILVSEGDFVEEVLREASKGYSILILPYVRVNSEIKKILEKISIPVLLVREEVEK